MEKNNYTLYELLNEFEVRIPIIQRDYAHGRDSQESIRKNLLQDIFLALETGVQLDFNHVYGNDETDSRGTTVFFPVDGQQRLTTLYLLHWYLECKGEITEKRITDCNAFSYMTRNSARAFFRMLRERREIWQCAKEATDGATFIAKAKSMPAFTYNWFGDPTVLGALKVLADLIEFHITKEKAAEYYEKLVREENPAIVFTMMSENSANSEIVVANKYIRMNARGKKLLDFEKLKAMIDSLEAYYVKKENKKAVNLMDAYEKEYINKFFEAAPQEDFVKKTDWIDAKSFLLFQSMYNIFARIIDTKCGMLSDKKKYREKIYDIRSKKTADVYEYLVLLKAVLEYQQKNEMPAFLMNKQENEFSWLERIEIAYIYSYYKKHGTVEGINKDRLEFILKNLHLDKQGLFCENGALTFAELLAGKRDIWDSLTEIKAEELCKCFSGPGDIKCRIKELYILKYILQKDQSEEVFFRKHYENPNNSKRKLQAFFYMAGYWQQPEEGNPDLLKQYLEISTTILKDENRISWWVCYSAGQVQWLTKCQFSFLTQQTNETADKIKTWNADTYFWPDKKEENPTELQEQMELLKAGYDLVRNAYKLLAEETKEQTLQNVLGLLKQKLNDIDNWLYYVVREEYAPGALVFKRMFYDGTTVVLEDKNSRQAFILYAEMLKYAKKTGCSEAITQDYRLDITVPQEKVELLFRKPSLHLYAKHTVSFARDTEYSSAVHNLEYNANRVYNMSLVYQRELLYECMKQEPKTYYSYAYNRKEDKMMLFSYTPGSITIRESAGNLKEICEEIRKKTAFVKKVFAANFNVADKIDNSLYIKTYGYVSMPVEYDGNKYRYKFSQDNRNRILKEIIEA